MLSGTICSGKRVILPASCMTPKTNTLSKCYEYQECVKNVHYYYL